MVSDFRRRAMMQIRQSIPSQYIQVEYIQSTGFEYIDTGIPFSNKYDIITTWQVTSLSTDRWFGGWYNKELNSFMQIGGVSGWPRPLMMGWGTANGNFYVNICNYDNLVHTTHLIKDEGASWDLRTDIRPIDYSVNTPNGNNMIFARNFNNTIERGIIGRIYNMKFLDNGILLYNFIPVYNTITQEYGLYESINGNFFGNISGEGAFIGPAIN